MIFVPFNVPSLKNSQNIVTWGKVPMLAPSNAVKKYLQKMGIKKYSSRNKTVEGYVKRPNEFEKLRKEFEEAMEGRKYPILMGVHFIRSSKRKFDFSNIVEMIQDLMTAHGYIEDDSTEYLYPVPMTREGETITPENVRKNKWYSVDKENDGVLIKLF